jgi:MoaA/NifB/PqqE/SkfB family radical SAM enzyme
LKKQELNDLIYQHEKNELDAMYHSSKGSLVLPFPPRSIWVETTTRCTLKCEFCAHRNLKRKQEHIPFETFRKIIDSIDEMLTEYGDRELTEVSLTRWGEPLLNPDIGRLIRYAKSKNLYTYLPTNGTVLTKDKRNMILESGLDKMNISVDTIDDVRHKKVMGIPIRKRMINILSFFKEKFERGSKLPIVEVSMVKWPGHEKEAELFTKFFELISADRTNLGDCFNLLGYVDIEFDRAKKTRPCFNPWYCLGIYLNGDCTFCLQDPDGKATSIGNCLESSVSEVWNGPLAQKTRKAVWNYDYNTFSVCENCNVNTYDRYQIKPFSESYIEYVQRMKTVDPKGVDYEKYLYLSHLQSISSGPMIDIDWEKSISVIDEVISQIDKGDKKFFDIAKSAVKKHS